MTDTVGLAAIRKSPLDEAHQRFGAQMTVLDGWSIPANYGDTLFEYASVRESGAGLIDLSPRGRILVSGSEAIQFLNGLITNDMKTLAVGCWMPAAFPNVQGRLIAGVRVIRLRDEGTDTTTPAGLPRRGLRVSACPTFLIDTEAATHDRVLQTIERFTLAGDFRVTDVTNQTAHLSLRGTRAAQVVNELVGMEASELEPTDAKQIAWQRNGISCETTILRSSHTATDGFELVLDADNANDLWEALCAAGARGVGYDALDMLRIEDGNPRYGIDMDETNVVIEAALDDAVSYTKGCYVGQEIIARIKYRGHVAKKLSGIKFDQAVEVEVGATIKSMDDKEIGRVTSATYSPHLGHTIALGYLKYDYLAPETLVKITSEQADIEARVTSLPFASRAAH